MVSHDTEGGGHERLAESLKGPFEIANPLVDVFAVGHLDLENQRAFVSDLVDDAMNGSHLHSVDLKARRQPPDLTAARWPRLVA